MLEKVVDRGRLVIDALVNEELRAGLQRLGSRSALDTVHCLLKCVPLADLHFVRCNVSARGDAVRLVEPHHVVDSGGIVVVDELIRGVDGGGVPGRGVGIVLREARCDDRQSSAQARPLRSPPRPS